MKPIYKNILVVGILTELTNSQTENFRIIKSHWIKFNYELKRLNLNQNERNWEKYGITIKKNEKYYYLTAIPRIQMNLPEHFIHLEIPKGEYKVYTHFGKMENIKKTINDIYKKIIPNSNLNIESYTKTGFIHFEKYDFRFRWDNLDSEIDIYLPMETNTK